MSEHVLQDFGTHIIDWQRRVAYFGEDAKVLRLVLKYWRAK